MAVMKQIVGARTSVSAAGLSILTAGSYVASGIIDNSTNSPSDVIVEIRASIGSTPSGNKQLVVFVKESLDGTNFRSGPSSGTSTTEEVNLRFIGVLPMPTLDTIHTATFSLVQSLGYCPKAAILVLKNDLGVTLSFGEINKSEISITVT